MTQEQYDEHSLVLAAEDFERENFAKYHFFTAQDKKNIAKLRAHGPVLLKGARGSGKSALMIEASSGLYPNNRDSSVVGIYVSLRHLDLLRASGDDYIRLLCKLVAKETNRRLEENIISEDLFSIIDLQDQLIELSRSKDKRVVLFFDDAAHIGREANLNDFFDAFRTLSNSYISCKASIYPGVTHFGTRFDLYNDATVIDINRSEKLSDFSEVFEEIVSIRFGKQLHDKRFEGSITKPVFCDLLGQFVLGNMRAFLYACNEVIHRLEADKSINFTDISESAKQLSSNYFWPLLEEIRPKLGMYEPMVEPAEEIAAILFDKAGSNNERTVLILREICQKLSKPLEILEYTGFVSKREVSRSMKSRGRGTRYMLNGCIIVEHMPKGRVSLDDYNRWRSGEEKAQEFHRASELMSIELPDISKDHELDILEKPVNTLKKSNAYPYGLTTRMIQTLEGAGINTIQALLEQSDDQILKLDQFGIQTLNRIKSTAYQAIWM